MQNKDICKHFAEASIELETFKENIVQLHLMQLCINKTFHKSWLVPHTNKCKVGGAFKHTFKYNINK